VKKFWLGSVALFASVLGGSALAADLGSPVYKAPPAPFVAPYSWTGCYIGGNVGGGWGDQSSSLAPGTDAPFWIPAFSAGAAPSAFSYNTEGVIGGGQIGCNYQTGSFVWGVEADFDGANITGSESISTAIAPFVPGTFSSSQKLDYLGTVRGRLGFTPADRWLVYATGGLAYGETKYNLNFAFPGTDDFQSISASNTSTGWTAGGGVEWAFWSNWSLRAEYLYVDLGDSTFTSVPSGRAANLASNLTEKFENKYNIVRLGLNYKFDWGAPVVSRY